MFALCTVASSIAVQWVIDHVIVPRFEEGAVARRHRRQPACALIIGIGLLRAIGVVIRRTFAGIDAVAGRRAARPRRRRPARRASPLAGTTGSPTVDLVARAGVDVDTAVSVMAPIPFATGTVLLIVVSARVPAHHRPRARRRRRRRVPGADRSSTSSTSSASTCYYDDGPAGLGELSAAVHESFEGVQLVKAYGAEDRETERLSEMAGAPAHGPRSAPSACAARSRRCSTCSRR